MNNRHKVFKITPTFNTFINLYRIQFEALKEDTIISMSKEDTIISMSKGMSMTNGISRLFTMHDYFISKKEYNILKKLCAAPKLALLYLNTSWQIKYIAKSILSACNGSISIIHTKKCKEIFYKSFNDETI